MKKPEKPYLVIDGDDAFPDFADPQWVEKMLATGRKYAAQRASIEQSQQRDPAEAPQTPTSKEG